MGAAAYPCCPARVMCSTAQLQLTLCMQHTDASGGQVGDHLVLAGRLQARALPWLRGAPHPNNEGPPHTHTISHSLSLLPRELRSAPHGLLISRPDRFTQLAAVLSL